MSIVKKKLLVSIVLSMAGFGVLGASETDNDAKKKIEIYPREISIRTTVADGERASLVKPNETDCAGIEKNLCFGFKVKSVEEERKIRNLDSVNNLSLGILNGIAIERNYLICFDPLTQKSRSLPAFCLGSIGISAYTFIDAFGEKQKNKDFNIKDPIYFDANFANVDFLWDNRWLGVGAAVATSTVNLQKTVIIKAGFIIQSENLRAEFGWLRVGFESEGNNGLYFGIGVPLISYATALKEKLASK